MNSSATMTTDWKLITNFNFREYTYILNWLNGKSLANFRHSFMFIISSLFSSLLFYSILITVVILPYSIALGNYLFVLFLFFFSVHFKFSSFFSSSALDWSYFFEYILFISFNDFMKQRNQAIHSFGHWHKLSHFPTKMKSFQQKNA